MLIMMQKYSLYFLHCLHSQGWVQEKCGLCLIFLFRLIESFRPAFPNYWKRKKPELVFTNLVRPRASSFSKESSNRRLFDISLPKDFILHRQHNRFVPSLTMLNLSCCLTIFSKENA